ncbi:MAG: type II and III secretion system protein family protein [Deltaproteobacteria bacterium]|nr:type II and III secretion system protein family protein [Deltaproteobacteria bacterium]
MRQIRVPIPLGACAVTLLLLGAPAGAGAGESTLGSAATPGNASEIRIEREVGAGQKLNLEMGQNRLLVLSETIVRVSVADPRVADLKVITQTQILLTSRGVGATDLTLWNKRDEPLVMSLVVTRNLDALRRQFTELFPGEKLTVTPAAGDLIVLSGEVSDVRIPDRAAEVAKLHAEKIANLIRVTGNQQVQLEVKFAEVSRRGLREIGFNFFTKDAAGRFVGGMANSGTDPGGFLGIPGTGTAGKPNIYPRSPGSGFSIFFSGLPNFPFSSMLSLLESTGLAKLLAEPTLVAMSGQEARFLAGGEFPIPMSGGLGAVTVQWKKFGIMLSFTPTVVGDGLLNLKLATEVSDIDASRSVTIGGFTVPGLTSRQSETTVRLSDGQSFAIAGLMSSRMRSQIDKIPLLGDLPILGALFRSISFSRDESELLVIVTAHLARPMAPHEVPRLPTEDEQNDPNDFQLFLLGSQGSDNPAPPNAPPKGQAKGPPKGSSPSEKASTTAKSGRRGPAGELGFIR